MSWMLSLSELKERCAALHIDVNSRKDMENKSRWGKFDDNTRKLSTTLYNEQNAKMELQNKNEYRGVSVTLYLEHMMDALRSMWDPANKDAGPMYTIGKLTLGYNALTRTLRNPSPDDLKYISGRWKLTLFSVFQTMNKERVELPATDAYSAQIQLGYALLMETLTRLTDICKNVDMFNENLPSLVENWVMGGEYLIPGWFRDYNADDDEEEEEKLEEEKLEDEEEAAHAEKRHRDSLAVDTDERLAKRPTTVNLN